jgi:hypothetical protein
MPLGTAQQAANLPSVPVAQASSGVLDPYFSHRARARPTASSQRRPHGNRRADPRQRSPSQPDSLIVWYLAGSKRLNICSSARHLQAVLRHHRPQRLSRLVADDNP